MPAPNPAEGFKTLTRNKPLLFGVVAVAAVVVYLYLKHRGQTSAGSAATAGPTSGTSYGQSGDSTGGGSGGNPDLAAAAAVSYDALQQSTLLQYGFSQDRLAQLNAVANRGGSGYGSGSGGRVGGWTPPGGGAPGPYGSGTGDGGRVGGNWGGGNVAPTDTLDASTPSQPASSFIPSQADGLMIPGSPGGTTGRVGGGF